MQFLMGLSEDYDHSKNQILLMDPVPTISKVHAMILKVEKQRVTHMMNTDSSEISALMAKTHSFGTKNGTGGKNTLQFKTGLHSTYSHNSGKGFSIRKGNYKRR